VILHSFPVAPNPTKVRLYIAEKEAGGAALGIDESLVDLPSGEQNSAAHLARNPLGKLPALELDDGSCVIESLAIIEFLEELHPAAGIDLHRSHRVVADGIVDEGRVVGVEGLAEAAEAPVLIEDDRRPCPGPEDNRRRREWLR